MAKGIGEYLLKIAPENLCVPAKSSIPKMGVNELLDLFIENINYCISEGYPSAKDLQQFGGELLQQKNIFIDEEVKLSDAARIIVLDKTVATVDVSGFNVSQFYFQGNSKLDLHVWQNAFVMIDAFDDAQIDVLATGQSKVVINLYGKAKANYEVKGSARVKVIQKNKKTY